MGDGAAGARRTKRLRQGCEGGVIENQRRRHLDRDEGEAEADEALGLRESDQRERRHNRACGHHHPRAMLIDKASRRGGGQRAHKQRQ